MPRLLLLAYAVLSLLFAATLALTVLTSPHRPIEQADYLAYHAAAQTALARDGACLYDEPCQQARQRALLDPSTAFSRGLPFNNPPSLAVLLAPLGTLPYPVGFATFAFISIAAWAAAIASATRSLGDGRVVAILLALSAWPIVTAVLRGQVTILVGAALLWAISLVDRSPRAAGALVGIASVKPTLLPLVLGWLLVQGRWAQLGAAALTAAGLLAATALVIGPEALLAYPGHALGELGAADAAGIEPAHMVNWRAVATWVGGEPGVALWVVGTLATLGSVAVAWWRSGWRGPLVSAAALVATPLVIPHANEHEAVLGIVAWMVLASRPGWRPRWLVPLAVALHAVLWLGLPLWGTGAAQLAFGALLVSLAAVVALALGQPQLDGTSTSPSGHGTGAGSSPADGGC